MRAVGLFVLGVVVGYLAVLFGWIGYAEQFDVGDMDGGKVMGVVFVIAPVGAIVLGVLLAVLFGRRRAPRA